MTTPAARIAYWFTPQSPWTYLGHERFVRLAAAHGATAEVLPADYGRVFPASGGLPLGKRAPQRQAYRLVELQRWSAFLGLPLNLHPTYFPVSGDDAARLIIAVDLHDGPERALAVTGAVLRGVWVDQRNIADERDLATIVAELGLPARRIEDAHAQAVQERYEANSQRAIEAGVFGAPTYEVDGALFWGQDRLDFLERHLKSGAA